MEQYLFHQIRNLADGSVTNQIFHIHQFWQVDFIVSGCGNLNIVLPGKQRVSYGFADGDTVVIPPGMDHAFIYWNKPVSWVSVKFISAERSDKPLIIKRERILEHTRIIIEEALSPHFMSRSASLNVVNSALGVAMGRYMLEIQQQASNCSEFVRQIREFVYSCKGRDVRVSDVGEALNCSGKHAAMRFRQETGENLKVFLDRTRADIAAKLLRTSSKSLEELAAQLEFRDVYAFSRFFKRTMNDTLSGYRKKVFLTFEWPSAKARSDK